MAHSIYLALGTNIGDRAANFKSALKELETFLEIRQLSPVYETPPWGFEDQPPFLNMVVEAATDLEPLELIRRLKQIEREMGRTPTVRFGLPPSACRRSRSSGSPARGTAPLHDGRPRA